MVGFMAVDGAKLSNIMKCCIWQYFLLAIPAWTYRDANVQNVYDYTYGLIVKPLQVIFYQPGVFFKNDCR